MLPNQLYRVLSTSCLPSGYISFSKPVTQPPMRSYSTSVTPAYLETQQNAPTFSSTDRLRSKNKKGGVDQVKYKSETIKIIACCLLEALGQYDESDQVRLLQEMETSLISESIPSDQETRRAVYSAVLASTEDTLLAECVSLCLKRPIVMHNAQSTILSYRTGMVIPAGFVTPYFRTSTQTQTSYLRNPTFHQFSSSVDNVMHVTELLKQARDENRQLLLIAPQFSPEVVAAMVVNKLRGRVAVCAVKQDMPCRLPRYVTQAVVSESQTVLMSIEGNDTFQVLEAPSIESAELALNISDDVRNGLLSRSAWKRISVGNELLRQVLDECQEKSISVEKIGRKELISAIDLARTILSAKGLWITDGDFHFVLK